MTSRRRLLIRLVLLSYPAGFIFFLLAVAQDGSGSGTFGPMFIPLILTALALLLWPLGALAFFIIRSAWRTHLRVQAWKKTLTPEQRTMVTLGQLAVLTAAHEVLKPHEKDRERMARQTELIMRGGFQ
jgi:hypothetical protein